MDPPRLHTPISDTPRVDEIAHGSSAYAVAVEARDRILRQPLGLKLCSEDIRAEATQRHFIIRNSRQIQGGLIAKITDAGVAQLRQMWVEPKQSGQGLGRQLIEEVMAAMVREGVHQFILHARQPVIGFYLKCGFAAEGPVFDELGIPHRRMTRAINPGRQSPGDHR